MTNIDKLIEIDNAIVENAELIKGYLNKTAEEVASALADKGYNFTSDELRDYIEEGKKSVKDGEIDESELQNVAGGCATCFFKGMLIAGIIGVVASVSW